MNTVIALILRAVSFELALYRSLFRWVTRHTDVPSGTVGFAYIGAVALLLWAFIVVSAIELVVLHLILPWDAVRLTVDVLSLWGLTWMLGLTASFNVYPHLATASGLRIRHGASADITIPWGSIATIGVRERSRARSRTLQVDREERGNVLNVVIASRTNVDVTLRRGLVVPVGRADELVTGIRLYADDARGIVSLVREQLERNEGKVNP